VQGMPKSWAHSCNGRFQVLVKYSCVRSPAVLAAHNLQIKRKNMAKPIIKKEEKERDICIAFGGVGGAQFDAVLVSFEGSKELRARVRG